MYPDHTRRHGDNNRLKPQTSSYWVAYLIVLVVGAALLIVALI